jgi:ribosomal protein S18 acetylase RimI-like enzyme
MEIRLLVPRDAASFLRLRLLALRESPDAFLSTYAEERTHTPALIARRLRTKWGAADNSIVGAFDGGRLVGICGFFRESARRQHHRATIWGMYVHPRARGNGVGRALIARALDQLRAAGGVELVHLGVATSNLAARRLYRSMGFRVWAIDRHAMKEGRRYIDEEYMVRVTSRAGRAGRRS